MPKAYRVAIIGVGARGAGRTGAARAYTHWNGYAATGRCKLAALADIVPENMEHFAEEFGNPDSPPELFTDYREMLQRVHPDIVSICTWPGLHAPMVIASAEAGVAAIHCEKPMAPTWAETRAMVAAVRATGTKLVFTHQRRFQGSFRAARRLVREGAIGDLQRMEGSCGNLFDWGTHWFDMFHFYNNESPARWVIGQIDMADSRTFFGVVVEGRGIAWMGFENGVQGVLYTGPDRPWRETNRLIGTKGVIEVQVPVGEEIVPIRLQTDDQPGWRLPEVLPEDRPGAAGPEGAAIANLISCLDTGEQPELSYEKALRATELIFGVYESSRLGARITLPLEVSDASLAATVAAHQR